MIAGLGDGYVAILGEGIQKRNRSLRRKACELKALMGARNPRIFEMSRCLRWSVPDEMNNKRSKAVRPPLLLTPSTIEMLPEGSREERGGSFERNGRRTTKESAWSRGRAKETSARPQSYFVLFALA